MTEEAGGGVWRNVNEPCFKRVVLNCSPTSTHLPPTPIHLPPAFLDSLKYYSRYRNNKNEQNKNDETNTTIMACPLNLFLC